MFGQTLFGQSRFAESSSGAEAALVADRFSFNAYGLDNASVVTSVALYDSMPERNHPTAKIGRRDGLAEEADDFSENIKEFSGKIIKSTASLLEAELSEFKKNMAVNNGNLDIVVDGVRRRYIATCMNTASIFANRQGYHITTVPFNVVFQCDEFPFGRAIEYTTEAAYSITPKVAGVNVENTGEVPAALVALLNLTTATAITALRIENETTGEAMTITRSFATGEFVDIDGENMTVEVDGTPVNYTGVFPTLNVGNNTIVLTWTGTSIDFSRTLKFRKTYY